MADDEAALKVDHLLAHIGAVVGNALDALRHAHQSKCEANGQMASGYLLLRIHHYLFLKAIDRVIKEKHLSCEVRIMAEQRTVGVAQHADHAVGHHAECVWNAHVSRALFENPFCNVHAAIGDSLVFIVALHDR
ncbi:MAG: hypothetical protein DWH86_01370 [Planctomycetota bacterium]|nr:MAG: hypothetical protein DWH86_01370 [Planctomycetota bacterium]